MTDVHMAGRPVVVGVDGSESALDAVRWAAREAGWRRVELRLVNAVGWDTTGHLGDPRLGGNHYREALRRSAHERLELAAAAAEQVAPGLQVGQDVPVGTPTAVLVAESRAAQLLVLGHRGIGGVAGMLLGSVGVALAAHSACPIVVVRGTRPGEPAAETGPVVVGVDGSPMSEAALAFAYGAADARKVPLVAVHTWRDYFLEPSTAPLLDWDAIEESERQNLAERLAGWGEKFPDVAVRRIVTRDLPAQKLIELSAGAQLVVVGSRGRGGFAGLLLGSVSYVLLHHATCPVAVVRAAGG